EFDVQVVVTGSNVPFHAVTATLNYNGAFLDLVSATPGNFIPGATGMFMDNGNSVEVMLAATPPNASVNQTGLVYTIRFRVNPNPTQATPAPFSITNAMAIPQGFDQIMLNACPTVVTTILPLCPQVATISAAGPTTFCQGGSVTLNATTDLEGAVIQWWRNGQPLGIFGQQYAATQSGTYAFSVAYFDCPLLVSNSIVVTVHPPTTATISGLNAQYCTNAGTVSVSVSPAGGVLSGPGVSGMMFNPALAGAGTHVITYSGTDNNGCSYSTSVTVQVFEQPAVQITGAPTAICLANSNIQLGATFAGGTFTSDPAGAVSPSGMFMPSQTGAYVVTYSGSNGPCTYSTSVTIEVTPNPVVNIFGLNTFYCANAPRSTLSAQPAGGTFSGPGIDGNEFSAVLAGPGAHVITYSGVSNGCEYSSSVQVVVNPAINLAVVSAAGPTSIAQNNGSITVSASGGQGGFVYTMGTMSNLTGVFQNLYAGLYVITATDAAGCSYSIAYNLEVVDPCPAPENVQISNLSANQVTLSWNSVAQGVSYVVQYRLLTQATWTTVSSSTNTIVLTGLQANSRYVAQVQTVCAGNSSPFSSTVTFTTSAGQLTGCVNPDFWSSNITLTSATVNWIPVSDATHYHVQYKRAGVSGAWTSINVLAPASSYTITGLLPNTTYEFRVRVRCGNTVLPWPQQQYFVTQGGAKLAQDEPSVLSVYPNPNQGEFSIRFTADNKGA
ncbi:MAG: fibronectin type III domain-containing protein, partial [Bacteroidia bacterium]|nr:fibronectin type III domain-containing protein [Bacteroidia bacterium]